MDQITILIFNALAKRQGVTLPGIGALYVTITPATMQHPGVVMPPVNRVELASEEHATLPNIVDLLADSMHMDRDRAQESYYQWLAEVGSSEGIGLKTIGRIADGVFTPDPELAHMLNPGSVEPVKLAGQIDGKRVLLWVLFGILVGTGIAVGLIFWLESRSPIDSPSEPIVSAIESVVPADSATSVPMTVLTPAQPVDKKQDRISPTDAVVPATVVSVQKTSRYQVIVGTYSTDENAQKFIASAKKRDSTLIYTKISQPNGRILISIFGSDTEADASGMKRKVENLFPDVWVYKAKKE